MIRLKNCSIKNNFGEDFLKIDDFKIDKGEIVQVVGKNNSGKTLFCRFLLNEKLNKEIFESTMGKPLIINIGLENNIIDELNILENILLPFKRKSDALKSKIDNFVSIFGLSEMLELSPKILSFSDKKTIEIIRAILKKPHLIIVDDFDLMFDEIKFIKIISLIENSLKSGTSFIFTSKNRIDRIPKTYKISNGKLTK